MTIPLVGVVDDDESLSSSLVDLVRSVGYCGAAYTSAEALLLSDKLLRLDCIVADVHMPGIGGLDLIRELHRQGLTIPVILITALPETHLDEEAELRGALCLLRKPFEPNSLLDWIARSLRR